MIHNIMHVTNIYVNYRIRSRKIEKYTKNIKIYLVKK